MRRPRWRTLLSLGLIGCMTLSLMPLGCASVKLHHYPGQDDRPRVPEGTEERLKECVQELKGDINAWFYSVDAKVKVDEEGDVVGVETDGTPNPEVGSCMSMALRSMRLSEDVLERGLVRSSASANGQAMQDRGQIGEVVTIVVVTIVFTEIVIDAVAITIAVAVTATATAGVAEAIAKRRKKPDCSRHLGNCLMSPLAGQPGTGPKHSLCHDCWMLCENGHWPEHVDQAGRGRVSCWYGPEADK